MKLAVTSLEHIHKKGRFGNYQKQSGKKLLEISEVKNLAIIHLVQYKKSKIQPNTIKLENLELPLDNPKVTANKETRILWSAPRTWLIISSKKNIISNIKNKCDRENFAITDISHSKSIIELEGNDAKEVLKKGCPFNFNEFHKNNCLNSTYNGMSIIVDMINDKPDKFIIFSLRSFGESLYHSLTDASLEFGYVGK